MKNKMRESDLENKGLEFRKSRTLKITSIGRVGKLKLRLYIIGRVGK